MNRQSQWLFEAPLILQRNRFTNLALDIEWESPTTVLRSSRFRGDSRLQAAANNSPPLRLGERGESVRKLQQSLIDLRFPMPISTRRGTPDGSYGSETVTTVQKFQTKHGLGIDGIAGQQTLSRLDQLFLRPSYPAVPPGSGTPPKSPTSQPSALAKAAISFAMTQIGVMENPLGSNRGPEVDSYLKAVGVSPGNFWCVAFTYFCYQKAAEKLGLQNPHIKTSGVLDHWDKAGANPKIVRVTTAQVLSNPGLVKPGSLFIIDNGGGKGHTGMVIEVANGRLVTIEGNTNDDGSSNGIGVFRRERGIYTINKGFIDYNAF